MLKHFIKNRNGQKLAVVVNVNPDQNGLAFVMHGCHGYKEQPQMQMMADVFYENGYTTVNFDTRHTFGESDGDPAKVTVGSSYQDLEDIITWAKNQEWYQEPFCLIGHSLGAMCCALYAEKYPGKIKALAPLSSVISGKLSIESPFFKRILPEWKRLGYRHKISNSKPGCEVKLPYSFVEDKMNYDLLLKANRLTMPVFIAYGENEEGMTLEHQQMLVDAIPGPVEYHQIKKTIHTFREPEALAELKELLDKWVKSL